MSGQRQYGGAERMSQNPAENVVEVASHALFGLRWNHPEFFPCRCPKCGWQGMSNETQGGSIIADSGDYDDVVCPECVKTGGWTPVDDIPEPNANSAGDPPTINPNKANQ